MSCPFRHVIQPFRRGMRLAPAEAMFPRFDVTSPAAPPPVPETDTSKHPPSVAGFNMLGRKDFLIAGGKGANLAEMASAGLPVPPGFVITAQAFVAMLEFADIRQRLFKMFRAVVADDPAALARASTDMQALIRGANLSETLRADIINAYRGLGVDVPVAVRSSATSEDTAKTSFAGMHESFTNVVGEAALIECVVACWASAYGQRALAYRKAQDMSEEPSLAVVVQQMVRSERSGVIFTADPATGDASRIVIEGAFGLGEVVVGGQVEPDTYTVAKDGPYLMNARIGRKAFKLVRDQGGTERRVELAASEATRRVLSDEEVLTLAELALKVEKHYGAPQDIEWAEQAGQWYLVQTRPITTAVAVGPGKLLVSGLGASSGIAHGPFAC